MRTAATKFADVAWWVHSLKMMSGYFKITEDEVATNKNCCITKADYLASKIILDGNFGKLHSEAKVKALGEPLRSDPEHRPTIQHWPINMIRSICKMSPTCEAEMRACKSFNTGKVTSMKSAEPTGIDRFILYLFFPIQTGHALCFLFSSLKVI